MIVNEHCAYLVQTLTLIFLKEARSTSFVNDLHAKFYCSLSVHFLKLVQKSPQSSHLNS